MNRLLRRLAVLGLATLTATGAIALPAAQAEEPDIPYFVQTTGASVAVKGDYNPLVGHFADADLDSILWYGFGANKESIWTPCPGCGSGPFTKTTLPAGLQVNGYYQPIVGDFAGNGLEDIYWFNQDGADYLWTATGGGSFASKRFDMAAGYWYPILLPDSRYGEGKDDVIWWPENGGRARLWVFPDDGTGVARTRAWLTLPEGGPYVGDFDGNGAADVFFYSGASNCRCPVPDPATTIDTYWRRVGSESPDFRVSTRNVKGSYVPEVGQFSGEGGTRDDILWNGVVLSYTQSTDRPDSLWEGHADGSWTGSTIEVPYAGGNLVLERDEGDTLLLFSRIDGQGNALWFDTPSGPILRPVESLPLQTQPLIGYFTTADREDMFAYYPGNQAEVLFHPFA